MGGLAVAARLAAQGHGVTVLEQAATHGGKLGRFARDGFVFDTGPSLLTLPAVYRDLFLKTAARAATRARGQRRARRRSTRSFRYRFADGTRVDAARTRPEPASRAGAGRRVRRPAPEPTGPR